MTTAQREGIIRPSPDGTPGGQCSGALVDYSRLITFDGLDSFFIEQQQGQQQQSPEGEGPQLPPSKNPLRKYRIQKVTMPDSGRQQQSRRRSDNNYDDDNENNNCEVGRIRLQETLFGFPIYGGNLVVTVTSSGDCIGNTLVGRRSSSLSGNNSSTTTPPPSQPISLQELLLLEDDDDDDDDTVNDQSESYSTSTSSSMLNDLIVSNVYGKSFQDINPQQIRLRPVITPAAAKRVVANHLGITRLEDLEDVIPNLMIFVSDRDHHIRSSDFLAYEFDEILITGANNNETSSRLNPGLYRAYVDAQEAQVSTICAYVDPTIETRRRRRRRKLRQRKTTTTKDDSSSSFTNQESTKEPKDSNRQYRDRHRNTQVTLPLHRCRTCANNYDILAQNLGRETSCPINSLYLDNTDKTTVCTETFIAGVDGGVVNVAGPVPSLFWEGTYNCFGQTSNCKLSELPVVCADAISDIQFVSIETLRYLQQSLNVLGGLNSDPANPVPAIAFAHYGTDYCNAFFRGPNQLFFGDCDCFRLTELVSIDIIAHEMGHGVTRYSSALAYSDQSGGLNEGYSDILGCVMEFAINDDKDVPDFVVAEGLGGLVGDFRYLEDPPMDGRSIDNIDDYMDGMSVHYSSGIPNKAFTTAVRACETNGCAGRLANCVKLVGDLFLYTNIQTLVTLSTFQDAAFLTCQMVPEYLNTIAFTRACAAVSLAQFVIQGWAQVGIIVEEGSCNLDTPAPSPFPTTTPPTPPTIIATLEPSPQPSPPPTLAPTGSVCFSELATVSVQDQGPKTMSRLQVGDYVQTTRGYQPIYAFAHHSPSKAADFLRIHTTSRRNTPLEISAEHLVYVWGKSNPVRADSVQIGDLLQNAELEQEGAAHAVVTKVELVHRKGLYAPLTPEGTLVVDGIVSSCYVSLQDEAIEYIQFRTGRSIMMLSQHFVIHMTLAPLRIACLGVTKRFCNWNEAETGLNHVVKIGILYSEVAQNQLLAIQGLLLIMHLLLFGSIYTLELIFGPRLSAYILVLATAVTLRGMARWLYKPLSGTKGRSG